MGSRMQMDPAEIKKTTLRMKNAEEVRFCFGVTTVMRGEVEVGMRLPPFEHNVKKVVTRKVHEELIEGEMKRVKKLTGKHTPWHVNNHLPNTICKTDSATELKGIAKKKEKS